MNRLNTNANDKVSIIQQLSSSNLNQDTQEALISKVISTDTTIEEDAIMDRIFGKHNPQMYVTLFMSMLVLGIMVALTIIFKKDIDFVKFIWNMAIPAVTLLWGYAFGKSQSK